MAASGTDGLILLDIASGSGEFDRDMLERFGHVVRVCHGPDHGTLCPLLAGKGCEEFGTHTASSSSLISTDPNIERFCAGIAIWPAQRCRSVPSSPLTKRHVTRQC